MSICSSLLMFYHHLITHVVPGPNSTSYFIAIFLLPIALLIPPSALSHRQLCSLFLPLIYAALYHAWMIIGGPDVISINVALWSFALLACRDPRRTFRRINVNEQHLRLRKDGSKVAQHNSNRIWDEPYPTTLFQRIPWVLTLMVSLRLTNWEIGEPSHDRARAPPRMTRSAFLRYALSQILQRYLVLDIASSYALTDPYFAHSGISVDTPFPTPTSSISPTLALLRLLPPRLLRASVIGGQIYAAVGLIYLLPALPALPLNALNLLPDDWSPHTWPPFFGPFSAVSSRGLRGLWGAWWHQMNRHLTATPGRTLAHALGVSTRSLLGYALLTISAFGFSGVMHMGLIPPEPLGTEVSTMEMRLRVAGFFWVQILGVGVEVVVSRLWGRAPPGFAESWVVRGMTVGWVMVWFAMMFPMLTMPFRELGYWEVYPMPVSVVQGIWGNGWLPWSASVG